MPGTIPRLLVTFSTQRRSVKEDDSDCLGNVQTRAHSGRHPEYGVHAPVPTATTFRTGQWPMVVLGVHTWFRLVVGED